MSVAYVQRPVSGSRESDRGDWPDGGAARGGGDFWGRRNDTVHPSPDEFRGNHFRPIGRLAAEGSLGTLLLDFNDQDFRAQVLRLSALEANLCLGEFGQRNLVPELHAALQADGAGIPELSKLDQFLLHQTLINLSKIPNDELKEGPVLVGPVNPEVLRDAPTFDHLIYKLTHGFENWESIARELECRSVGWNEPDAAQRMEMIGRVLGAFEGHGEPVTMDRFKLVYPFVGLLNQLSELDISLVVRQMLDDEIPFNHENRSYWAESIGERQKLN